MTLTKAIHDGDAPPPYTPTDPLTPSTPDADEPSEQPVAEEVPSYSQTVQSSPNFISAVPYFTERPPTVAHGPGDEILEHAITIYTRSQAQRLCPIPTMLAISIRGIHPARLANLPRKLRQEIERDRKDRPQENDEQRKARIAAVAGEWNSFFFRPRAMNVVIHFAPENGATTTSPLCPKCYPSAVRSMPLRPGAHASMPRSQTAPAAPPYSIPRKPVGERTANPPPQQPVHPSIEGGHTGPQSQQRNVPNQPAMASWASTIQKWANNMSEQAQRYGDHIERQALAHGRRAEDRAEAWGRIMEAKGQMWENYFDQQGKRMEQAGEQFEQACKRRSPWLYPWNPSGPWGKPHDGGRNCGGMGPHWGPAGHPPFNHGGMGSHWGPPGFPMSSRSRKASISSLSTSSSSSSTESLSSFSSDSEDESGARPEIDIVRQSRLQARHLYTEHRARAAALRHERCALRAAHRDLRSSVSRDRRHGAGHSEASHAKAAEAEAIKAELVALKREHKELRNEFHQERKQIRRVMRNSKKEQQRTRRAEKRELKRNRKHPERSQSRPRGPDIAHEERPSTAITANQPPLPPLPPVPPPIASQTPGTPASSTTDLRAGGIQPDPSPMDQPQRKSKNENPKASKGKGEDSSKEPAPTTVGWGWTGGNAGKKSSGFRKKKQEPEAPSMQWSGDGKQESGVLPVNDEEEEENVGHGSALMTPGLILTRKF
ncbi:predicted protein [Uncinocarpus reesii 1704]|uniref:Uncharacterized protein n=1 Tax=Uncinocarpus reesii (strain UAMH 1704) TaxID=336963 RepID=C4JTK4_UNCRE|nr:uncharacterized protein UREG_05793 [Uncinocarpus reesii 1704]EEP80951.1 predicted protein [Uncinocarpus reesii 1704]